MLLILQPNWTFASPPNVLLFGANLSDARSFAVENATSRGWRILTVASTSATFEQLLDGDEEEGVLVAERTLRVFADFSEEADGSRVSLRAEEVEWPGTEDEWRTDVTERYSDNLLRALASLRGKWEARHGDPAMGSTAAPPVGHLAPESTQPSAPRIGAWAYVAERYALGRGCELTDRATRLESSGQDWEQHRVFCRDGSDILVQCRYGDCAARH
ncbi:hypothetical protein CKO27_04575 [Thiocystis violacea]|nr:hypothetical protein [Thiocystis violacea]